MVYYFCYHTASDSRPSIWPVGSPAHSGVCVQVQPTGNLDVFETILQRFGSSEAAFAHACEPYLQGIARAMPIDMFLDLLHTQLPVHVKDDAHVFVRPPPAPRLPHCIVTQRVRRLRSR